MFARGARALLHAGGAIGLGVAIYFLFRSRDVAFVAAASNLGADAVVTSARAAVAPLRAALPPWFLFNLPDALWAYAFAAWLGGAWERRSAAWRGWLVAGGGVVAGLEIAQAGALLPGTFDVLDLIFSLGGFALGALATRPQGRPLLGDT